MGGTVKEEKTLSFYWRKNRFFVAIGIQINVTIKSMNKKFYWANWIV